MEESLLAMLEQKRNDKQAVIEKMSDPDILKNQKEYEQLVRDLKELDK